MKIPGKSLQVVVLFAAAIPLAGCDAVVGKPNVYKMPVARAWEKLAAAPTRLSGTGPFGRLEMETDGRRYKTVEWSMKGSQSGALCSASLTPLEAEQTRVDVSCKGGDAPAAGLYAMITRKRVIEMVDAALKDRPYDPKKAEGSTAAFWPADVIDHGNLGTAAAKALEMDRQMAADLQRMHRN
jgi:hypothetical protein